MGCVRPTRRCLTAERAYFGRAEQPALVRVSRRLPGFARSGTEDVRTERGGVLNGKPRSGSRTEASVEQRAERARLPTPVGESARVPLLRRRRFDVSLHALSTGSPAVLGARRNRSSPTAPRTVAHALWRCPGTSLRKARSFPSRERVRIADFQRVFSKIQFYDSVSRLAPRISDLCSRRLASEPSSTDSISCR